MELEQAAGEYDKRLSKILHDFLRWEFWKRQQEQKAKRDKAYVDILQHHEFHAFTGETICDPLKKVNRMKPLPGQHEHQGDVIRDPKLRPHGYIHPDLLV